MEIIRSQTLLDKYFQQYPFTEYFSFDIKPYTSIVHFEPDEVILQEGASPSHLYFLFDGRAKLFLTHKNGTVSLINFLEAPCFIGEMELLDSTKSYHGVVAIHACSCFSINLAACKNQLLNDAKFLRHLCHFISKKTLGDIRNYSRNQSYPLKNRLASFILMTAHNGIYCERHTETAGFLGVTYRHLLYVLAEFVKDGVLEKTQAGYRIVKLEELKKLAELS